MILLDPGHGQSNKAPGVYDPGIVGVNGTQEAGLALVYAKCLLGKFAALDVPCTLTRATDAEPCPLLGRLRRARELNAELLISLHFNGDANPGNSPTDGKTKGCEVLHRLTPANLASVKGFHLAQAAAAAMARHIAMRKPPVVDRQNLAILNYYPSILVEVGFLDDADDFKLLADPAWMDAAMTSLAAAVKSSL